MLGIESKNIRRQAAVCVTLDPNRSAIEKECKLPILQIVITFVDKSFSPAALQTTFPRIHMLIFFRKGRKRVMIHCIFVGTLNNNEENWEYPSAVTMFNGNKLKYANNLLRYGFVVVRSIGEIASK